ncbi:hypothetical protein EII34_14995 [Arachnia propionica]|uniref:Uncharacterized protein n=1 Tax=Arachnia propionica TaxID=1750 RepID=A0A3P1T1A3_9ACTN|nr:hypothetical protein [Arachnia propionica]RRD03211.1 hypothetical protein EII34_14995 [Arachnia propionica]
MTTNRDAITEWIEEQGETDATMLATAILDASHALAAIHEQLRIANLIALAAIDPDRGGPSEELASVASQACGEISTCRGYEVRDHDGTPDRIEIRSLLPDIAAALGTPQEEQP